MKLISTVFLGAVLLTSASQAASSYSCGSLSIKLEQGQIAVSGLDDSGEPIVGLKTKFKPSAAHKGSTRYDVSSVCQGSGSVFVILDKSLSTGEEAGQLVIQSTCDADGNGPSYEMHTCSAE